MKYNSALMTDARGSIGGITASRNAGGAYFRRKVSPVQPLTEFQGAIRGFMLNVMQAWVNVLDDVQRAAWKQYADATPQPDSLGNLRSIGGPGAYVRTNVLRLQAGLTRRDDAPTEFRFCDLTAPTLSSISAGDQEAEVAFTNSDEWATADGGGLLIYAGRPRNPSVNFFKGPYRFAKFVAGAETPPTSPVTVTLPFPVSAGNVVGFRFIAVSSDGRVSSPFRLDGTASA